MYGEAKEKLYIRKGALLSISQNWLECTPKESWELAVTHSLSGHDWVITWAFVNGAHRADYDVVSGDALSLSDRKSVV